MGSYLWLFLEKSPVSPGFYPSALRDPGHLAGRDRGGDVLCLGAVPAWQSRGCHNGPCHDERPDRRGGSDLWKLELVAVISARSGGVKFSVLLSPFSGRWAGSFHTGGTDLKSVPQSCVDVSTIS